MGRGVAQQPVLRKGDKLQVQGRAEPFRGREAGLRPLSGYRRRCPRGCGSPKAPSTPPSRNRPAPGRPCRRWSSTSFSSPQSPMPSRERARGVDPRCPVTQRCVHVEMRIDEGRRNKIAGGVDHRAGLGTLKRPTAAIRSPEIPISAVVPSGRVPPCHKDIETGISVLRGCRGS